MRKSSCAVHRVVGSRAGGDAFVRTRDRFERERP